MRVEFGIVEQPADHPLAPRLRHVPPSSARHWACSLKRSCARSSAKMPALLVPECLVRSPSAIRSASLRLRAASSGSPMHLLQLGGQPQDQRALPVDHAADAVIAVGRHAPVPARHPVHEVPAVRAPRPDRPCSPSAGTLQHRPHARHAVAHEVHVVAPHRVVVHHRRPTRARTAG